MTVPTRVYQYRFVLTIEVGSEDRRSEKYSPGYGEGGLEMITLKEANERGLKETGGLTFAIAPYTSIYGTTAYIPEEKVPSDAVAYRIGHSEQRFNASSGRHELFIPVAFYKR